MAKSEYLRLERRPDLRSPFLLAAFAGWNDAGQAATTALDTLIGAWSAEPFADIEPDDFFDFGETRPMVSLDSHGQRSITWPSNQFFAATLPGGEHDVILLSGTEPQLKWPTFCREILSLAEDLKVEVLITLGALLADVPHTVEPRLTGFVSSSPMLPSLKNLRVLASSYEGPTGIIGALHDAWRATERPATSLWGNVPHYISSSPNPQVSLALLQRVSAVLGAEIPLEPLQSQASMFAEHVEEALKDNPEAAEYVQQLEEQAATEGQPVTEDGLLDALEEYLRSRRPDQEGEA